MTDQPTPIDDRARGLLAELAGPDAVLRADQLTAIRALVDQQRRVLVVQRTGWGKSAVYFIATSLLRAAGAGPTLLISPLLALMRDQIAAAERIGVAAETINSTNVEDWDAVTGRLASGDVDLLLISPERLNHPDFRDQVLARLAGQVGLVVVDEAHCVSDWGHDFRPDYRRIATLLEHLPDGVPVLATTATANDRVVTDVASQLGTDPLTLRGELDRASLRLAVQHIDDAPSRMAWLAAWVAQRDGAGIIYCLTVADTQRVAAWLADRGIAAEAYSGKTAPEDRERIEASLKANELDCVVATTALGMGYDKPDLTFVVHMGMPSSPIAYYQAIGRAGRAVEQAEVVLVPTQADEAVWAWFAASAFPPADQVDEVLAMLDAAGGPVSTPALESGANLGRTRLESMLKVLDVEGAVRRVRGGWESTGATWHYDQDRLGRIAAARRAEQEQMRAYATTDACLMRFLRRHLDDPATEDCGRCANCAGRPAHLDVAYEAHLDHARRFLRQVDTPIFPRKRWPAGVTGRSGAIGEDHRGDIGRVLADGATSGWEDALGVLLDGAGEQEARSGAIGDVVEGLTATLSRWDWEARPKWICPLPSRRHADLLGELAERLGALGRLPVVHALTDPDPGRPWQSAMANSTHQAGNAMRGLTVTGTVPAGPALVIDDEVRSGWTLTVAADLLRGAGASRVLPLVLRRTG